MFCVVNIKENRVNKFNCIIYANCAHRNCRRFRLDIVKHVVTNGYHNMNVRASSCNRNQGDVQITRFWTGAEREEFKEKLRHQKPMQFLVDSLEAVDVEFVANGNLQSVKSLSTIQKIRHNSIQ